MELTDEEKTKTRSQIRQVLKRAPSPGGKDNLPLDSTPDTSSVKPSNIFQHFAVFFACGSPASASRASHILTNTDDTILLPILLHDIIQRKCSFEKLTRDLSCYCHGKDPSDFKAQVFLNAVMKILPSVPRCDVTEVHVQTLAHLVYHLNSSLEDLLSVICDLCDQHSESTVNAVLLELLQSTLRHAQIQEACRTDTGQCTRFIDKTFSFGETALLFAARRKNMQVMVVLLRYGADMMSQWLNFRNVLEVLLFAPHTVYLTPHDIDITQRCAALVYTNMATTPDIIRGLDEKDKTGYFPLCPNWRTTIPNHISDAQGLTLRHMARKVIRDSLQSSGQLPAGIVSLPLPKLIQDYVDIIH